MIQPNNPESPQLTSEQAITFLRGMESDVKKITEIARIFGYYSGKFGVQPAISIESIRKNVERDLGALFGALTMHNVPVAVWNEEDGTQANGHFVSINYTVTEESGLQIEPIVATLAPQPQPQKIIPLSSLVSITF